MKRFLSLLLAFALLLGVAMATGGDPNIEGGGGGVGEGGVVGDSAWNPGDDGVRVSIMQGTTAKITFDISNILRTRTQKSFKVHNKLFYKNGGQLSEATSYTNLTPPSDRPLPTIIPSGGGSNIDAIRNYFTDETVIRDVAAKAGMAYDELTGGDYKLLLEPMAYFKYNGVQYAMSATEAALFDVKVSGDLKYQMGRMTHQNLPLSMFLERSDLGIAAWAGAASGKQTNIDILRQLGVGIVSFSPEEIELPPPSGDYIYRTDTDVITAVQVPNLREDRWGDSLDCTPSSPGTATFTINGVTYNKRMICPAGGEQNVWVKWHTPSTPGDISITVKPPGARYSDDYIHLTASIVDLEEKTPPNAEYDGPGQGPGITHTQYRPDFRLTDPPRWGSQTSASWYQWVARWESDGMFGWWEFSVATYTASLNVDFKLIPDVKVPTEELRGSEYTMKSGYGVDAICNVRVYGPSEDDVTPVQNVLAVFPEFDYQTYNRLLVPNRPGQYSSTWGFKSNPYSYSGEPVHFTPVWYPDIKYPVQVAVFDVWTPGGMLYATVSDHINISGSMYDDWYIRVY